MNKTKKLNLIKNILKKLSYENRISNSINKDLEIFDEEELLDIINSELEEFKQIKIAFGVEALTSELLYIYYMYYSYFKDKTINVDLSTASLAIFLVVTGLGIHLYAESEIQKSNDKIYKLEKIIKESKDL